MKYIMIRCYCHCHDKGSPTSGRCEICGHIESQGQYVGPKGNGHWIKKSEITDIYQTKATDELRTLKERMENDIESLQTSLSRIENELFERENFGLIKGPGNVNVG